MICPNCNKSLFFGIPPTKRCPDCGFNLSNYVDPIEEKKAQEAESEDDSDEK